jgi:hypothetical protein
VSWCSASDTGGGAAGATCQPSCSSLNSARSTMYSESSSCLCAERLARRRHACDHAAVVDPRAVCDYGIEQVDILRRKQQHCTRVVLNLAVVFTHWVAAVEAIPPEQAFGEAVERRLPTA